VFIRNFFTIIIAKLLIFFLKLTKTGGTAAPGLLALKLSPNLLKKYLSQLDYSILISGTNGKTTTSRMLSNILKEAEIKFYHNRAGSNLLRGILSELLKNSNLKGRLEKRIGLWEIDEAVLPQAIKIIKPKVVIINNLFRDQLDRYGEIDTLAKKWLEALNKLSSKTTLIINADDPTLANLGKKLKTNVIFYGINDLKIGGQELSHASDATLCPLCLLPLKYQAVYLSHLGNYKCSSCGLTQPQKQIKAFNVNFNQNSYLEFKIVAEKKEYFLKTRLSGLYNVYNFLAGFGASLTLGITPQISLSALKKFQPVFGRTEKIKIKNKSLQILLVKNPTGFNEIIKTLNLLTQNKKGSLLLVLNDLIADGRDVSWIWDVDFDNLKTKNLSNIYVSGIRSADLALRLKYSLDKKVIIISDLKKAIRGLLKEKDNHLFILPTYTAMLKTRKILNQMKLTHLSWQD